MSFNTIFSSFINEEMFGFDTSIIKEPGLGFIKTVS